MAAILLERLPPVTQRAPRALVLDDHPIVADALSTAIGALRVFDRIDSATSLAQACAILHADPVCSLAFVDLHLSDVAGREMLTGLRERFPDVPVLVFSGDESLEGITVAFECGARGCVTGSAPIHVVNAAIRLVLAGGTYIPPEAAQLLGFADAPRQPGIAACGQPPVLALTGRQRQALRLLLQGIPNKVIGARLNMADATVKAHLDTAFRVLGVRTRVEAILRARELGLS